MRLKHGLMVFLMSMVYGVAEAGIVYGSNIWAPSSSQSATAASASPSTALYAPGYGYLFTSIVTGSGTCAVVHVEGAYTQQVGSNGAVFVNLHNNTASSQVNQVHVFTPAHVGTTNSDHNRIGFVEKYCNLVPNTTNYLYIYWYTVGGTTKSGLGVDEWTISYSYPRSVDTVLASQYSPSASDNMVTASTSLVGMTNSSYVGPNLAIPSSPVYTCFLVQVDGSVYSEFGDEDFQVALTTYGTSGTALGNAHNFRSLNGSYHTHVSWTENVCSAMSGTTVGLSWATSSSNNKLHSNGGEDEWTISLIGQGI